MEQHLILLEDTFSQFASRLDRFSPWFGSEEDEALEQLDLSRRTVEPIKSCPVLLIDDVGAFIIFASAKTKQQLAKLHKIVYFHESL